MTIDPLFNFESSCSVQEVSETLLVMRKQESTIYRRSDFSSVKKKLSDCTLDGAWRQRVVEWMYRVVDHCNIQRDVVAVAAYYLDLSLEHQLIDSIKDFHLCAITALQLSFKLYDSVVVELDSIVTLGQGMFTREDVIEMELKILKTLKWHVHPPTQVCFLRQYLRLLPSSVAPLTCYLIAEVTRFISEVSVCLSEFTKYPPSVIAYASMSIAMDQLDFVTLPQWQRQQIFDNLERVTGLTAGTCEEVKQATVELEVQLSQNACLRDLMTTVDALCRDRDYKQCSALSLQRTTTKECATIRSSLNVAAESIPFPCYADLLDLFACPCYTDLVDLFSFIQKQPSTTLLRQIIS